MENPIAGKLLNKTPKKPKNNKERFNLIQYLKESKDELKKVSWPTRKETWKQTWVVIGISLGVAAFLGIWDFFFNYALEWYLRI